MNNGSAVMPVTMIDDVTGQALASGTLIASLPAKAASTLTSSQVTSEGQRSKASVKREKKGELFPTRL
jgi:hypothetical protein